jgi:hypothetical protein
MEHESNVVEVVDRELTRSPSPSIADEEATTPIPHKSYDATPTPTDSLVSISLTDSDRPRSVISNVSTDETSAEDVVSEVLKRASEPVSPVEAINTDELIDAPGAEERLVEEVALEIARSRSNSMATTPKVSPQGRERSDSSGSDSSLHVDWETLDQTEQIQDQESDEVRLFVPRHPRTY